MYSLMIVDDEEIILNGISDAVKVSGLPFKDIRKAQSAREALEKLSCAPCDILVTDISMPGQNGLEMVREAKRIWPDLRVLFLTGYQDFEYAREALRLGSDDFLIKPLADEKLLEAIIRVVAQLDKEWMHRFEMRRDNPAVKEKPDSFWKSCRLIFLRYDDSIREFRMGKMELQESLCSMLERTLAYYCRNLEFLPQPHCTVLRIELKESWEVAGSAIHKMLEEIQSFFLEQLDIEMTVAVSGETSLREAERVIARGCERIAEGGRYGKLFLLEEETKAEESNYMIQAIQDFIRLHPEGDLSLGALSERFHINPSYLSRIFHQETGQPLSEHILQLRMKLARQLLKETDAKIYEIAEQTGFGTSGYFTKVFQKHEHMSPRHYRIRQGLEKED